MDHLKTMLISIRNDYSTNSLFRTDPINDKFLERRRTRFILRTKYGATHKRVKSLSTRNFNTSQESSKVSTPSKNSYMLNLASLIQSEKKTVTMRSRVNKT